MIAVRERRMGSWLDRASAAALGMRLAMRLWDRVQGQPGLFVTLTYNRGGYADALDLYRAQSERQHVAKFIKRLQRKLGRSLKGQWIRKMEFQGGGWVHWHLLIMGESFIPNKVIEDCWGHGFTKTKGLTRERCFYMTKYVTKGNIALPSFIWGEPPRSVKIIAVSPGFWGDAGRPSDYCPIYAKYGPAPRQRVPVHVPIGYRIKQCRGVSVGAGRPGSRPYGIFTVTCEPALFMAHLSRCSRSVTRSDGWMWFDCSDSAVRQAATAARRESGTSEGAGAPGPRSGAREVKGTRKPDHDGVFPPWRGGGAAGGGGGGAGGGGGGPGPPAERRP